jgi:outer membrane protein OmpA-like peptidoglycan-associated protein
MVALKAKIEKAEKDMMDDDRDGVPNYLDQEPGTATDANVDTKGKTVKVVKVVDMDGDGVLDVIDFCPTIKGAVSANGCPDKDGDGIYDFADKCPNAAGLAADGGCPVVSQKTKDILWIARTSVKFDIGKSEILKESFSILDKIAVELLTNPSYNLSVNAHAEKNKNAGDLMLITKMRAKVIKDYLIQKGVSAYRIESNGFGDTQPCVSQNGDRKQFNERIEFLISFEQ